jgi:hypothetical protein
MIHLAGEVVEACYRIIVKALPGRDDDNAVLLVLGLVANNIAGVGDYNSGFRIWGLGFGV